MLVTSYEEKLMRNRFFQCLRYIESLTRQSQQVRVVISDMDNEIIEKIKRMGNYSSEGKIKSFDLKDLLLKFHQKISIYFYS